MGLAALAGVAVLVGGCGGGSGLTVASLAGVNVTAKHASSSRSSGGGALGFLGGAAPTPAQQAQAQVTQLKFSRCMRAHGVPNFPDPSGSGGGYGGIFGGSGIDPAAPLFRVAQRSCIAIITHQRRVVVVG